MVNGPVNGAAGGGATAGVATVGGATVGVATAGVTRDATASSATLLAKVSIVLPPPPVLLFLAPSCDAASIAWRGDDEELRNTCSPLILVWQISVFRDSILKEKKLYLNVNYLKRNIPPCRKHNSRNY